MFITAGTRASRKRIPVTPAGSNTQVQFNSSGSFGASSALTFNSGTLTVGVSGTLGKINLLGNTSGTVTLNTKAVAGTYTLTFPDTAGSNGNVLTTDGTGILSWTAPGAASISIGSSITGGTVGRVLFEGAGPTLDDDSALIWDDTLKSLVVGTATVSYGGFNPGIQANSTGADGSKLGVSRFTNDAAAPRFILGKSRGTSLGSMTAVSIDDQVGRYSFQGADGTNLITNAELFAAVDDTVATGIVPSRFVMSTMDNAGSLTERVRIDSPGRFLINTQGPSIPLASAEGQFQAHSTNRSMFSGARWSNDTTGASFNMGKSRGTTVGSHAVVSLSDTISRFVGFGSDGTNFQVAAHFRLEIDDAGTISSTSMPGKIVFATCANGAVAETEALRIDSGQKVRFSGTAVPHSNDLVALGTTALMWSDLFLASGAVVNFNNGDVTLTHGTDLLTVAGGGVKVAAGTTAIAPLTFQSGTNLTTATTGAVEYDGETLYFSTNSNGTGTALRGGVFPAYVIRLDAGYTLGSNTNVQKMFNASTNGTLTLPVGSYIFDAVVGVDTMSATSGNAALSIIGAGTATLGSVLQVVQGIDGAKATAGAATGGSWSVTNDAPAANTSVVTAQTAAEMAFYWKGSFKVTTAGTIIPSIDLITANAAVVKAGSYMAVYRVAAATTTTIGPWT